MVVEVVGASPIGQASAEAGSSSAHVGRLGQRAAVAPRHGDQRNAEAPA